MFVLPIFVISNFPTLFGLGKMPLVYLTQAPIVLCIVRPASKRGLRTYNSANSRRSM